MQAAIIYRVRQTHIADDPPAYMVEFLDKYENVKHWYVSSRLVTDTTVTMTYPAVERAVTDDPIMKHTIELLDNKGKVCHRSNGISREFAISGLKNYGFSVIE